MFFPIIVIQFIVYMVPSKNPVVFISVFVLMLLVIYASYPLALKYIHGAKRLTEPK